MPLDDLIDLDRYPIHELEARPRRRSSPSAVPPFAARAHAAWTGSSARTPWSEWPTEAGDLAVEGYPNDATHNCYFDDEIDESLPVDHPRRIRGPLRAEGGRDGSLMPEDFGSRRIYASDEVLAFVAAALEKDVLHRSADPLDGVNMTVYEQGDELGWHFDQSEFSVTLMIQRSQAGGDFEYAPMVRTPDDERYDAVRSVLIGDTPAKKLASDPGTLAFFRGRYSLHRVPPVVGSTPRMNSVLTYSVEPGHMLSEMAQRMYYGRTA